MRVILFLAGILFFATPADAQHLSYCDWRIILDRSQSLVSELEGKIVTLGDVAVPFEQKDQLVRTSLNLFSNEAAIRSDIEPDPGSRAIVRGIRLDKPNSYLDNVGLYYDQLSVEYKDLQVSYMKLGERFKKPEITYEFTRVLRGVGTDGNTYEDIVNREVTFDIKKDTDGWIPYINVIDYDQGRTSVTEAQGLIAEVNQGCQSNELNVLVDEREAQEQEIEEIKEDADQEVDQVRQNDTISEQEQQETIRQIEERRQRELEEREQELERLRRRELAEQKRLRLKTRRKRLFTPTFYLGGGGMSQSNINISRNSGEDEGKYILTLDGGIDLAYFKANASIMVENEPLSNTSLAENGFTEAGTQTADSISVFTVSAVAGLPLMIGKEVVFFAGGGGMYSNFSFTNNGEDIVDQFTQIAPIAQASLTWVLPERGGGFTLAYRRSLQAKYNDIDTLGLYVHYHFNKSR